MGSFLMDPPDSSGSDWVSVIRLTVCAVDVPLWTRVQWGLLTQASRVSGGRGKTDDVPKEKLNLFPNKKSARQAKYR